MMNTIKSVSLSKVEPVYVEEDGTQHSYVPRTITTARDAYAASLHLLFNHVADFHSVMITIISEKYGIPEEDIFNTVRADPRFTSLVTAPVAQSMGYFDEDDLSAAMVKMSVKADVSPSPLSMAPTVAAEPATQTRVAAEPSVLKKPVKRVLKKKVISLADE